MGYTTFFSGSFSITPPLKNEHRAYLKQFSATRRMKRNPDLLKNTPDPLREAAGLPLGTEAEFFVNGEGEFSQNVTPDVTNPNRPPSTQPSLWCDWEPNDEGTELRWNRQEKTYAYATWLEYMIEAFFKPWGYELNGTIHWSGENHLDNGELRMTSNTLEIITL